MHDKLEAFRKDYTENDIVTSQLDVLSEIEDYNKTLYSCSDSNFQYVELDSIINTKNTNILHNKSSKKLEGVIPKE